MADRMEQSAAGASFVASSEDGTRVVTGFLASCRSCRYRCPCAGPYFPGQPPAPPLPTASGVQTAKPPNDHHGYGLRASSESIVLGPELTAGLGFAILLAAAVLHRIPYNTQHSTKTLTASSVPRLALNTVRARPRSQS